MMAERKDGKGLGKNDMIVLQSQLQAHLFSDF